jgi:hypothetical protein
MGLTAVLRSRLLVDGGASGTDSPSSWGDALVDCERLSGLGLSGWALAAAVAALPGGILVVLTMVRRRRL